ncbi:MAG TPA: lysine--tRNA ligase [Pseudonocardiaceae bacterium]
MAEIADRVVAEGARRAPGRRIVCASGISPSGPIHLGNLREIMVPHLVADEIRRRGLPCRHLLSWDDYDRLRKVPADVPESFAEHIGRPLTSVPDPCGEHENWAEHFKAPLRRALREIGVVVEEISQTRMYESGAYRSQILTAMRHRAEIGRVLHRYRTAATDSDEPADGGEYYPYKPYCATCGRDSTTITSYDDETTKLTYTCDYGHSGSYELAEPAGPGGPGGPPRGKLVWKVDWPMRWAYEGVTMEPAGVDHSSPGSSFTVGGHLVRDVFGGEMPYHFAYSFVGTPGAAKMSGSAGRAPTPADALRILEAPILRWLYARRKPNQSITVAFDQEVGRLYDEWEALGRRVAAGTAKASDAAAYARSVATTAAVLPQTPRPVPFRTLASIADITGGDEPQMLRILRDLAGDPPVSGLEEFQPRLDRARNWVRDYLSAEERTQVRTEPDTALLATLTDAERRAIRILLDGLDENWSLPALTALVYGVPKLRRGLPIDSPPTPELKVAQREFFALLYRLLVGRDTGPRLPTLLMSLGKARIRALLPV